MSKVKLVLLSLVVFVVGSPGASPASAAIEFKWKAGGTVPN
jgi:hypothetical protein